MSLRYAVLGLWILMAVATGYEMNQMRLEMTTTVANYLTHVDITHRDHEDQSKKPKDRILKRKKRTLVLLRNLDSEKGAEIGDSCDFAAWEEHVQKIYNTSNNEGIDRYEKGMELANNTRIYTENRTFYNVDPGAHETKTDDAGDAIKYKTWPKKLCIGRYPLQCNKETNKCECLFLPPFYNFTQDLPDEKFCNVLPGSYCMESVDLYCAHSYACIDNKCQIGPNLTFNGQPRVITYNINNNYTVLVIMYISMMIMYNFQ